jgi:hypothetical protein
MKRPNPFSSPVGIILTILLFLILGISLWRDRGLAFNPGPVTGIQKEGVVLQGFSSHADFEKECHYCHMPLETTLGQMCLTCHTEISNQLASGEGIHGHINGVTTCQNCHPEHKGRDFNPTLAATKYFDHSITRFSLIYHQVDYDATPMACTACHDAGNYSLAPDANCQDCHSRHNPEFMQTHLSDFGENCQGCHDGSDRMINFDHKTTSFPLDGLHVEVVCSSCHVGGQLTGLPTACEGCHSEPEIHRGLFDANCGNCHNTQGWSPATFDGMPFNHLQNTRFSLDKHQVDYAGQTIVCSTCHQENLRTFNLRTCIDCHTRADTAFMQDHQQTFGADCLGCHDGVDRMSGFDHNSIFLLDGKHAEIACADCHLNQVFAGTPSICYQCHAEPEIHAGIFGLDCQFCHTTAAWSPATLLEHNFPLDHGIRRSDPATSCSTCHPTNYVEYTCYGCHDHQLEEITQKHNEEGITPTELPACATCHPTGQKETGGD